MTAESVPFVDGLFGVEAGRPFLLGNRCGACGRLFFPARPYCFDCSGERVEAVRFGAEGVLYSFTVSRMASARFAPPYRAGWVDVAEGVRVFAPLEVEEGQALEIGMRMDLVVGELWRQGEKSVTGYRYKARRTSESHEAPGEAP